MLLKTLRQRLVSKDFFFFFNVRHPLLLYIIYKFIYIYIYIYIYRVLLVLVLGCFILFKFDSMILFSLFFLIIIKSAPFPYDFISLCQPHSPMIPISLYVQYQQQKNLEVKGGQVPPPPSAPVYMINSVFVPTWQSHLEFVTARDFIESR